MTNVSCFFSEFLATAVLAIAILGFNDRSNNTSKSPQLFPFALFLLILGIGASLGMETGKDALKLFMYHYRNRF
jgi:aquaglyceroporin related protein, other eukaryote